MLSILNSLVKQQHKEEIEYVFVCACLLATVFSIEIRL